MTTIPTKSILEQFLDRFECWMSLAEFGSDAMPLHAPLKTTEE